MYYTNSSCRPFGSSGLTSRPHSPWSTGGTENVFLFMLNITASQIYFFFRSRQAQPVVAALLATHVLQPTDEMTD